MKKLLSALITLSVLATTMTAAFAEGIGTIDYEKVLTSYNKAIAFNDDRQIRQTEIENMKAEFLKQLREAKKNQANNPVAYEQLQKDLQTKLNAKQNEASDWVISRAKTLEKEITTAIDTVAANKHLDTVVESRVVFHGGTDITNEVITQLNK